jgi:hypothetical protein
VKTKNSKPLTDIDRLRLLARKRKAVRGYRHTLDEVRSKGLSAEYQALHEERIKAQERRVQAALVAGTR